MKVIIKGSAREIAALVLAIQERQMGTVVVNATNKAYADGVIQGIRDFRPGKKKPIRDSAQGAT